MTDILSDEEFERDVDGLYERCGDFTEYLDIYGNFMEPKGARDRIIASHRALRAENERLNRVCLRLSHRIPMPKDTRLFEYGGLPEFAVKAAMDFVDLEAENERLRKRPTIVSTPGTLGGAWRLDGHRISVDCIADLYRAGDSMRTIADAYGLTEVEVLAAVQFAQETSLAKLEKVAEAAQNLDIEDGISRHRLRAALAELDAPVNQNVKTSRTYDYYNE